MNKDVWYTLPDHVINPNPLRFLSENYGVIDFETTNLDKGSYHNLDNHLVSFALYDNASGRGYSGACNEFDLADRLGDLTRFDYLVAFNASFELGWLWRAGYNLRDILCACPQIGEYTLAGNQSWGQYPSLDECLKRRALPLKENHVGSLIKLGVNPADISEKHLLRYNEKDVTTTNKLWKIMRQQLLEKKLLPVFYTKCLYTPVLVDIETYGLHLDAERTTNLYHTTSDKLQKLEEEWDEITGGVNPKSPKQKVEYFYGKLKLKPPPGRKTKGGAPSTDAATLGLLVPKSEEQRRVLRLVKEITKLKDDKSKVLDKCYDCVVEAGGRLLFRINQTATQTHRLSSSGQKYKIQGQNIHRLFKPLFTPRKQGWKIGEIDQDSLEFRVAGHLGRDEQAKEDIVSGKDPHEMSGQIIFEDVWNFSEHSKSEHNKPLRQDAKAETFKPLYGGIKGTPKQMKYYQEFRKRYRGIAETQERWADEVVRTGALVTENGMRFYWPGTVRYASGGCTNFQNICNYPVQYLATGDSGITAAGVILQWHMMQAYDMKSFVCNTIHDSSISEVAPEEQNLFKEIAEWAFTTGATWYLREVYGIDLFIPLSATVEYSTYWSEKDE